MKNKIKKMIMKSLKHDKMRKEGKLKGFTLVELIVVIAIIGVLAAILIPTMMGRVKESRWTTANDAAAKIVEQAAILITDYDAEGKSTGFSGAGNYTADAGWIIVAAAADDDETKTETPAEKTIDEDFKKDLIKNIPTLDDSAEWAIHVNAAGAVDAAAYRKNDTDKYLGTYPKPNSDKDTGLGFGKTSSNDSTGKTLADALDWATPKEAAAGSSS